MELNLRSEADGLIKMEAGMKEKIIWIERTTNHTVDYGLTYVPIEIPLNSNSYLDKKDYFVPKMPDNYRSIQAKKNRRIW